MDDINKIIRSKDDAFWGKGVSSEEINFAEEELGIIFSDDYKAYLRTFGLADRKSVV